ncbi:Auxin Efflux Carrier [Thalassoporum mexicanum PCC 7367]|uniref:AEC family transporter n=1 Tax=Thalassoporum mexicanum TaxID=3457544 RepID=UPI00029FC2E0|nr:AEC family transporter [Pseudanabaena sp. PCC 7367]AFY71064.1 Auxin Efflux Carrier [Pseudanabaena sp. PCC 7367]
MTNLVQELFRLYAPLIVGVLTGLLLGWHLPPRFPDRLGKFLFWVGAPISIVVFLRGADLSEPVLLAPLIAWIALCTGLAIAWFWLKVLVPPKQWSNPMQGSFILASMLGNTGYLGYPVTLALVGAKYFAWALLYDLLGTMFGSYGIGVMIASRFSSSKIYQTQMPWQLWLEPLKKPVIWSFIFGLGFKRVSLPLPIDNLLHDLAWGILFLALTLIGMRLSQLSSFSYVKQAAIGVAIKMLIVPLAIGVTLSMLGINGLPRLVLVLQGAMPPAFATLVIAEAYDLDKELTVTALGIGSAGLLITLPIWLWLFAPT